jgi:hypothetical protein
MHMGSFERLLCENICSILSSPCKASCNLLQFTTVTIWDVPVYITTFLVNQYYKFVLWSSALKICVDVGNYIQDYTFHCPEDQDPNNFISQWTRQISDSVKLSTSSLFVLNGTFYGLFPVMYNSIYLLKLKLF